MTAFGIDTSANHLDLLAEIRAAADFAAADPAGSFFTWNGGARPVFAGRNFLGKDFIWGHSEATNASREPDGNGAGGKAVYPLPATDPSPDQQQNLTVLVDRIAPMQASDAGRQQLTGNKGRICGQIDGDAICKRLVAAINSSEFSLGLGTASFLDVWLSVDPDAALSDDYWAGWANTVNNATLTVGIPGILRTQQQLFRAGIFCKYTAGADQKLRPDPALITALGVQHPGMTTNVHGFWADFQVWANAPADLVANGSPLLDFTRFDAKTAPALWRFADGFTDSTGATPAVKFHLDAANPALQPTNTMLQAQQWQPSVPTIQNVGFSNTDAITDANVTCIQRTPWPGMNDINFAANAGHFHVPGGPVTVIGRYIRHSVALSMGFGEVQRVSGANLNLFSIWESVRTLAGMGSAEPSMQDTNVNVPQDWGDFNTNFRKNIFYFKPDPDGNPATHDDAGTLDGTEAFHYCGDILKQPPQTPIYFCIDFDPFDVPDPHGNPAWGGPGPQPAKWTRNWPALPAVNVRKQWIKTYYENIKIARDAYAQATGRYYLIGAYAPGLALELLYGQGIVSHFWQADSTGRNGSKPPRWPYFHCNRWQYHSQATWTITPPAYCGLGGSDPDADWGDGGAWSWLDHAGFALTQLEDSEQRELDQQFQDFLHPPALPPPPPPPPL